MSLSRRTFTKEFKEAAVQRPELGASVAEVARACEVNPNVLYRWRRELREYATEAFPSGGHRRIEERRRLQALTTRSSSTRTLTKKCARRA